MDIKLTFFGQPNKVHANYRNRKNMATAINTATGMCRYGVCKAVKAATQGAVTVTGAAATCSEGAPRSHIGILMHWPLLNVMPM
jgi:hypothetical protein